MSHYTLYFAVICALPSKSLACASVCKEFVKRKLVGVAQVKTVEKLEVPCRRARQRIEWGLLVKVTVNIQP